mmetsp:Transcript_29804/g.74535  ORF Transcript_29804/g.74535 Transcript_29804/m.74535 type:complete len:204 (+) Transcript_29804:603-1214(+)
MALSRDPPPHPRTSLSAAAAAVSAAAASASTAAVAKCVHASATPPLPSGRSFRRHPLGTEYRRLPSSRTPFASSSASPCSVISQLSCRDSCADQTTLPGADQSTPKLATSTSRSRHRPHAASSNTSTAPDSSMPSAAPRHAPPSGALASTSRLPSTRTFSHCSSATSRRTSARSASTPPAIFCSMTSHSGPMAGSVQKMNPGP